MTRHIVTVPSYDDTTQRRRLLLTLRAQLGSPETLSIEGVRRTPDGVQIMVTTDRPDARAFASRQPLSPSTGKADGPRVAAVARRLTSQTLVGFRPFDHEAILQDAAPLDISVRDALAHALRVDPWEIRLWIAHDTHGHLRHVHVERAPGSPARVAEALLEVVGGLRLPLTPQADWRIDAGTDAAVCSVISRPDPLREILLATGEPVGTTEITVGRTEDGDLLHLDLAQMATSMAVQGQTRSGKSIFAYGVLSDLGASPNVIVAGADPSGVLLAPFAGTRHAPWQVLGTKNPEGVLEVLERLVAEMDRRTAGMITELIDKLEAFTPARPMFLVVLEEFPGLRRGIEAYDKGSGAGPSDRLLPRVDLLISRLLAEGAKAGFRLMILAQRLDTTVLQGGDRANVPTRISFRVDNSAAVGMLHESLPIGLDVEDVRSFQPGVGLYESSVAGQRVIRFRSPFLDGGYKAYVARVRSANPSNAPAPTPADFPDSDLADDVLEVIDLGTITLTIDDFTDDDEPFAGWEPDQT